MALTDTPWCGREADRLYLQSGKFSSTLKTSQSIGGKEPNIGGISWDGTNTPWCGDTTNKLWLTSGQFSSTLLTSENIGAIDPDPRDISWDGTNTPWIGSDSKLYLQSGQFSSTLLTSQSFPAFQGPSGISWDGTDTPWCASGALKLQSGQFSSTLKTSQSISGLSGEGISWDGTDTLWVGNTDNKLYLTSGQFTSTIKTSQSVGSVDLDPKGIETNDVDARIAIMPGFVASPIATTLSLPAPSFVISASLVQSVQAMSMSAVSPHINTNVPRPNVIPLGLAVYDPDTFQGIIIPPNALSLGLSTFSPTVNITVATVVFPPAIALTGTAVSPIASTVWATADVSLPLLVCVAASFADINCDADLPLLELEATGFCGGIGSVNTELPMLTLGVTAGTKVSVKLPAFTLVATGRTEGVGKLTKPLPMLTLVASGRNNGFGVFAGILPMLKLDAIARNGGIHSGAISLPNLILFATGVNGVVPGSFSGDLTLLELSANGYCSGNGSHNGILPLMKAEIFLDNYNNRII